MSESDEISLDEWRESLNRLESLLRNIAEEAGLADVIPVLSKRIRNAQELFSGERIKSLMIKDEHGIAFISAGGEEPRKLITVKTKSGVVEIPTYLREFYITQVGPYGIKCTCDDALMTSSKADKNLMNIAGSLDVGLSDLRTPPISSRYVICKHTLALTSLFTRLGVMRLDDPRFLRTLKFGVLTLALREGLITSYSRESSELAQLLNELIRSEL